MSRPEPIDPPDAGPPSRRPRAVEDVSATPPAAEVVPPEVDWGAVLRGCPCRTCVEARAAVYASDPAAETDAVAEAEGVAEAEVAGEATPPPSRHAARPAPTPEPPAPPPEFVDPWSDPASPGAARDADPDPREASAPFDPDALEARLERALGALLDARLAPIEKRVDALLDAARRERGPIGTAARALSRFADEVEAIVSHVADPDRPPRR